MCVPKIPLCGACVHKVWHWESSVCHCSTSTMMVEDFLRDCQIHQNLRAETWPADTLVGKKLYHPVKNLQHIMAYMSELPELPCEQVMMKKKNICVCACVHMWVDVNSKFHF